MYGLGLGLGLEVGWCVCVRRGKGGRGWLRTAPKKKDKRDAFETVIIDVKCTCKIVNVMTKKPPKFSILHA